MPLIISDEDKTKIIHELKWKFDLQESQCSEIIDQLKIYMDMIEEIIGPEKIEASAQNIIRLVYEYGLMRNR